MVKICYQSADNMIPVPWSYHQLGVAIKVVKLVLVHPLKDVAVGLGGADVQFFKFVGIPLEDVHGIEVRILAETDTKPID